MGGLSKIDSRTPTTHTKFNFKFSWYYITNTDKWPNYNIMVTVPPCPVMALFTQPWGLQIARILSKPPEQLDNMYKSGVGSYGES